MSNKDIVVSSEKGTILNYFGAANTYNPFTNESNMQLVEDLDFKIPERTAIVDAEWVAVSTGLITTSISFLQNCTFQIVDKNSGAKITDLTNIIGEVGNIRFMPSENQIFWFNVDGLRGTFYIHKNHCGHYLKIVSGVFVSTSITSGVLNEMFERSIGVPNYITNINNTLKQQDNAINGFQNQINSINNNFQGQINNILQLHRTFHNITLKWPNYEASYPMMTGLVGVALISGGDKKLRVEFTGTDNVEGEVGGVFYLKNYHSNNRIRANKTDSSGHGNIGIQLYNLN